MRKILAITLSIILLTSTLYIFPANAAEDEDNVVWDGISISESLGGTGTFADPYLIATGADLALIRQEINNGNTDFSAAHFKQTADIDLNGYNISPIGPTNTDGSFLSGGYNGEGFTITNFVINSEEKYVGLFGYIAGAYIKNLKVDYAFVSSNSSASSSSVGIIVGYINLGSTVSACQTGANSYVEALAVARPGGLVGWNYASTIEYSINRAMVAYMGSKTLYGGGITSTLGKDNALIDSCINIGPVIAVNATSTVRLGGITGLGGGSSGNNDVKNSYNIGLIANLNATTTAAIYIGGVTGADQNSQAKYTDCYNVGPVYTASGEFNAGKNYVGSIIGFTTGSYPITSEYCYSLVQTGVNASGDAPIPNISSVNELTNTIGKSDGSSTTLGAALAQIDSAVSAALGIEADWALIEFDIEGGQVAIAAAIAHQDVCVNAIANALDEGEERYRYRDGDVLYEADFSDFEALSAETDFRAYGLAYDNGGTEVLTCEGGKLLVKSLTTAGEYTMSGRLGTRLKLYDVPLHVNRFSVTVDIRINEYLEAKDSFGPALLIADNGISDPDKTDPQSMFSMIWLRMFQVGATGAYTYGDTSKNVVSQNEYGFSLPETTYTIKVYVDVDNSFGVFSIINKATGTTYFVEDFYYNPCQVNPMVGIMVNGCDVEVENLAVYYGDGVFGAYTQLPDKYTEDDLLRAYNKADNKEPATGDTTIYVVIAMVVSFISLSTLLVIKRKKSSVK